ncbi:MAG TPA: TonB-dependent receptor [Blastocatellia bacterium]|nr:TonB-dependent receptor [Blastocatellia bacterium]
MFNFLFITLFNRRHARNMRAGRARSKARLRALRLLSLFIISSLAPSAFAAFEGGGVEGTVSDPAGAGISGARVTLRDGSGQVAYQTRTDSEGRFALRSVASGAYAVTAEAQGFAQSQKISVNVGAGASESLSLRLEIAAVSDQIVVTSTRTDTPLTELGGSVSVINAEDFDRAGHSLVSEPLRQMPGISVAQTGGRGGLTSIFARGGESDYNKVLIDGVPVNLAGGLFDFASLTPENFERVEVVRGPRSALFGSDAMTSVFQFVTKRGGTETPELELSGEGGSFDYHRETARLSGLAGRFDYSASFGFQNTDGHSRNSDYTNRSASANLGFRLSRDADLRITSRWNNNSLGVAGPVSFLLADPDQRQKHRDLALSAAFQLRSSSRWHHTARYIYSEIDTLNFDPAAQDLTLPGDTPPPFGNDFQFSLANHQKRAGVHYQTVAALTGSNILTGGIDFEHESAVFTDQFSRVSPDRNNLGLYLQDQHNWRDRLFLTAGFRVERNRGSVPGDLKAALESIGSTVPTDDVGFGTSANPKIAASLLARKHVEGAAWGAIRLKSSFGTGIKEPSLEEAFSPNLFFLGNPSLDPERAISFDAGVVQELLNRRVSLELTYFDNRFRDLIVFTFDPITFGPVELPDGRLTNFINLDRASARGLELAGAARPLRKMRLSASYTFLRSRVERDLRASGSEEGLPLLRRPRHSGAFEVSWVDERFDVTVDGSLVGRRRELDPVSGSRFDLLNRPIFNDGYAKLNAAGTFRITRNVSAFTRAENLLDQDYEEILGFPAYGRNFTAGLRLRIGGDR